MDIQFKQRLTGAVILVGLAVLIVPAVLTGPQAPSAVHRPPGEAAPVRSYTIDLSGATPPRITGEAAAPEAVVAAVVPRAGFAVQLGSFANIDTANLLAGKLRGAGFVVSLVPVNAGGHELQRVRVGPVADRAAAEALAVRLSASGYRGPIVPYP